MSNKSDRVSTIYGTQNLHFLAIAVLQNV